MGALLVWDKSAIGEIIPLESAQRLADNCGIFSTLSTAYYPTGRILISFAFGSANPKL
jgi:hypothetical protein